MDDLSFKLQYCGKSVGTIEQVEDGRDGGNPEFDGEVTDQYTAEVTFKAALAISDFL